ncbi:MAG: hypothetical protein SFV54_17140 [Bryobacteraceae bacterium]|nr:hypothetical protein [Bryobacteraceae bacterium]
MRKFVPSAVLAMSLGFALQAQVDRVPAGTEVVIRTVDAIDAKHPSDSRIYRGEVERDVLDRNGRVVIPRGADAELIMRDSSSSDIVIDLESIAVGGTRYTVDAREESVGADRSERREGVGANKRTGKYVGGGALLGTVIGAIAGGGKGAAIGAIAGAGAGAAGQTVTRGGSVRLPSESVLTFRLDRPLRVGVADDGYDRDGRHYHRYGDERQDDRLRPRR